MGKHANDRLAIFSVGIDDGKLWSSSQVAPNSSWNGWVEHGRPTAARLLPRVAVSRNSDGRLEAFALAEDGNLWHVWQHSANGSWSAWQSLSRPGGVTIGRELAAVANPDGRLEVFSPDSNGNIWHLYQQDSGGWSSWKRIDAPPGTPLDNLSIAAVLRSTGITLLAQDRERRVWSTAQDLATADGWGDWMRLGDPRTADLQPAMAAALNQDGRAEVFAVAADGGVHHIFEHGL
jgi:hypothetical protein